MVRWYEFQERKVPATWVHASARSAGCCSPSLSAYFLMGVRGPALPSERGVLPQMASDAREPSQSARSMPSLYGDRVRRRRLLTTPGSAAGKDIRAGAQERAELARTEGGASEHQPPLPQLMGHLSTSHPSPS